MKYQRNRPKQVVPAKRVSLMSILPDDAIKKPVKNNKRLCKANANNPWFFNGKPFEIMPSGFYGFVYVMTNKYTRQQYIGRKFFVSVSGKGKKATYNESNWRSYWSSSKAIRADIAEYGKDGFTREILILCKEKRDVDLQEVMLLWSNNVLGSLLPNGLPAYYNDNISGKYYRRDELFDSTARIYANSNALLSKVT